MTNYLSLRYVFRNGAWPFEPFGGPIGWNITDTLSEAQQSMIGTELLMAETLKQLGAEAKLQ